MTEILDPVAKISPELGEALLNENDSWDIFLDLDGNTITNDKDAEEDLDVNDYAIIEYAAPFIGAPAPRRRKRT